MQYVLWNSCVSVYNKSLQFYEMFGVFSVVLGIWSKLSSFPCEK